MDLRVVLHETCFQLQEQISLLYTLHLQWVT
jgi:hypothetical protein